MSFPHWSAENWARGTGTSLAAAMPTHAAGDLIVVAVYSKSGFSSLGVGGFTLDTEYTSATHGDAIGVCWKIAASAAETLTITGITADHVAAQTWVFPSGTFDASDPLGSVSIGDGAGTAAPDDFPEHTPSGDANENVLLFVGNGEDITPNGYGGDPLAPWTVTRDTNHRSSASNDIGLFSRSVLMAAGDDPTTFSVDLTAHTRGYMLAVIPIRSDDAAKPTTEDFASNDWPGGDLEPGGPLFDGYERQDSTSYCQVTGGRLLLKSKSNTNRFSAAARAVAHVFADVEALFDLDVTATITSRSLFVWLRHSGSWGPNKLEPQAATPQYPYNGAGVRIHANEVQVVSSSAGTLSTHGTAATPGFTGAMTIGVRARIDGNRIRARVWDTAGAEPGTWDANEVITAPLASGWFAFQDIHFGGGDGGGNDWFVDDVELTASAAPSGAFVGWGIPA